MIAVLGALRSRYVMGSTQPPDDDLVTQQRYDPNERLVLLTLSEGNRIVRGYDALGRLTSVTKGANSAASDRTRFEYDAAGRLRRTLRPEDTDGEAKAAASQTW